MIGPNSVWECPATGNRVKVIREIDPGWHEVLMLTGVVAGRKGRWAGGQLAGWRQLAVDEDGWEWLEVVDLGSGEVERIHLTHPCAAASVEHAAACESISYGRAVEVLKSGGHFTTRSAGGLFLRRLAV